MNIYNPCRWLIPFVLSTTVFADPSKTDLHHEDLLVVNPNIHMSDVLDKTFANNPQQATLKSMELAATARDNVAHAVLPATPAVIVGHQNDSLGSNRGEREWQAELELPVWLPNQRINRIQVASAAQSNIIKSRDSLKLQVAGNLREALWDIALNNSNAELATSKLVLNHKLQNDVEKRYKAGELAKTDVLLAEQETLRAEKELLRAKAELMHARHRYFVLTGLREIPANYEEKLSTLVDYAQSPLWLESKSKLELAETERNLATIESRENSQVMLGVRRTQGAFDHTFNDSVGFRVRIPFGGDGRAALVKSASELNLGQTLTEREKLKLFLETAMHEAEHNLVVTRDELNITEKQLEIASESQKLAQKGFQLGETDLVSLLRIQAQTYEAQRAFTTRQIQLQWDIARYNQAVGVLP